MAIPNGIQALTTQIKLKIRNRIRLGIAGYSQLFFYSFLFSYPSFTYASPAGDNIVGGSGYVHTHGNITEIHQLSSSLAIDWAHYDVGANEIVNYDQPGVSSIVLNRILNSGQRSEILGQIIANGQVVLANPNGIFFDAGSQVNVGGLIASGLTISSADFMNGNYVFKALEGTAGTVENAGVLSASLGGSITLLGKQVTNSNLISANLGAVNLASGKEAVLTFDNAGLIGVKVTKEILQNELGVDAAIINNGTIEAKSGRILLTASQSQDVFKIIV